MEEIRFVAAPITARYLDKIEEERQAARAKEEEAAAKRKAELEAKRKAEEEAKKAAEPNKAEGGEKPAADGTAVEDTEMKDAEPLKPDSVEEP